MDTSIVLPLWMIACMAFYKWYWQGEEVRHHYGHYPLGHLLIGIASSAPITFMLGMWMAKSMGCDI